MFGHVWPPGESVQGNVSMNGQGEEVLRPYSLEIVLRCLTRECNEDG